MIQVYVTHDTPSQPESTPLNTIHSSQKQTLKVMTSGFSITRAFYAPGGNDLGGVTRQLTASSSKILLE